MKKLDWGIIGIVVLSLILNVIGLSFVPQTIATHWNVSDQADGFMPKVIGLFGFSLIMGLMAGLFIILPRISRLDKKNPGFVPYYAFISFWAMLFFLAINIHILLWNTGTMRIAPSRLAAGAVIVLFIGLLVMVIRVRKKRG